MRVLIFGDSITQGMWDSKGGWAQRLIAHYFDVQMKNFGGEVPLLFNLGISADTTDKLLKRFGPETAARLRPDMAFVFAIGTNDARIDPAGPYSTPERYVANLERLLSHARQYSERILFVGLQPCDEARTSPTPWHGISYSNERLKEFDRALRDFCAQRHVAYVPVFEAFQRNQQTPADLLIDGLHPDDKGHQVLFERVRPELEGLLKPQSD